MNNFLQYFKYIPQKIQYYLRRVLSVIEDKECYSIDYININARQVGIIERGRSIEFKLSDFNHYLFMIHRMPSRDVFLLAYLVSREEIANCSVLEKLGNDCYEPTLVLEGEDRAGMFLIFDVIRMKLNTLAVLEILNDTQMIKRFSKFDVFQIGLLSGKNKSTIDAVQDMYFSKFR